LPQILCGLFSQIYSLIRKAPKHKYTSSSAIAETPRCRVPSKWGSKTQNGRFPCKIALRLKKVCNKVSLCKNCQRQSFKAFIGVTIRAKMIGEGDPFCLKFFCQTDRVAAKSPIFDLFSLVAPQS